MTTYTITANGNDTTGNGTVASPWRQISKAAAVVNPGDIVNVGPGSYTAPTITRSGTATARIKFVSTTKWGAVVTGMFFVNGAGFITVQDFDCQNPSGTRCLVTELGDSAWFLGNKVHNTPGLCPSQGGAGIHTYRCRNNIVEGNQVYDIGNFTAAVCQLTHGIYIEGIGDIVRNNLVYHNQGFGIHLWHGATQVKVINNTVFNNWVGGIIVGCADADCVLNDFTEVRNNIVYDNGVNGARGGITEDGTTGTNNVYSNNLVFGNTSYRYSLHNGLVPTSDLNVLPGFINYVNDGSGNYHLLAGSPCIDTGTATSAPTVDFDNITRPKGSAMDRGAFEFTPPVTTLIDPTTPTGQMPNGKTGGYTLVMSDEFNSTTLSTKWKNEHDFADHTATTAWDVHKGGNSLLRMWWNGNTATDNQQFSSTGATPFRQRFGFWEAKMKCISGKGFFPGFWLYPYSNAQVENGDGNQHEIDIVEWFSLENGDHLVDTTNYQSKNAKFTVWTDGGGLPTQTLAGELYLGGHAGVVHGYDNTISTTMHTYGLEWTAAGGLNWYFDGVFQGKVNDPWGAASNVQLATFLQLWWGGNGGNPVPASPQTTAYASAPAVGAVGTMDFDYVRVWTIGGGGPPPPPPLVATLVTATYADNATITGNANFQIHGDSIQNAELLGGSAGTYTPSYGTFTLGPGGGGAGDTVAGVLNWNTLALSNGPITVHISAFSQPPGSGGSEVVVTERHYIINNVLPPNSVTASAADRDMQFITSELDFVIGRMSKLRTYVKTGK